MAFHRYLLSLLNRYAVELFFQLGQQDLSQLQLAQFRVLFSQLPQGFAVNQVVFVRFHAKSRFVRAVLGVDGHPGVARAGSAQGFAG